MTVQINYKSTSSKKYPNKLVLFVDENFTISGLKKHFLSKEFEYISDLLKNSDKKKIIATYDISSKRKIILVSCKKK